MIHGRFQPFHNGHFDYLVQALAKVQYLVVGITDPDPTSVAEVGSDSHRHLQDANPFSYYSRLQMITKSVLLYDNICERLTDITIVPFPIHFPSLWKEYVPPNVVQLIRLIDPWDKKKQQMFLEYGFDVIILDGTRLVSGTEIRKYIFSNNPIWRQKVPHGSQKIIKTLFNKGQYRL